MSKDPALLFYTSDFLTGTMLMSDEQVGKYIRLLCIQHQKGRLSKEDMLKICKTYDKDIFGKFAEDKDGLWFNARLEIEATRRRNYSESRRKNRLKKQVLPKKEKTYVKHMETETEDETITDNEDDNVTVLIWPTFEDFWNQYDKKVGDKVKIEKKWDKISQKEREKIMVYIADYVGAQPNKQYRKNPETFINNKSWNDEIIKNDINGKHKKIDYGELLGDLQEEPSQKD